MDIPAQIEAINPVSNAQMVIWLQQQIALVAANQEIAIEGRTFTRANIKDLYEMLAQYKRLAAQDEGRPSDLYVRFNGWF